MTEREIFQVICIVQNVPVYTTGVNGISLQLPIPYGIRAKTYIGFWAPRSLQNDFKSCTTFGSFLGGRRQTFQQFNFLDHLQVIYISWLKILERY